MDEKSINSTEAENEIRRKILTHSLMALSILFANGFVTGDENEKLMRRMGHYMVRFNISDLSISEDLEGLV